MSFKFNNAVQRLQPLSGHAVRLILWYLADHANDQGVAYASYETLMRACQIKSRTTINEGLKELEALKILRKIHRPNQCVKYVLSLSVIQSLGLTGVNLGESELNEGTLGDTADSTVYDTPEPSQDGPAVRSPILPGVSTIERGSTLGDTLSTCTPPVKEIHKEAKAKALAPASASILSKEEYGTLDYIYHLVSGNQPTDAEKKLLFGFPIDDPVLFAHQMIWAYKVSANYELNGLRSFLAALPSIEQAYEKYQAKLGNGKVRPEIAIPDLPHIVDYATCLHNPDLLNPAAWEYAKVTLGPDKYAEKIPVARIKVEEQ